MAAYSGSLSELPKDVSRAYVLLMGMGDQKFSLCLVWGQTKRSPFPQILVYV